MKRLLSLPSILPGRRVTSGTSSFKTAMKTGASLGRLPFCSSVSASNRLKTLPWRHRESFQSNSSHRNSSQRDFSQGDLSQRGASLVEFTVSIPILFLLVVMLTELSHLLLLRSALLAGVQRGLQTAQALPELIVDSAEIEPESNSFDKEKFERYEAARRLVVDRTTETPLQLFFQPPEVSDSAVRLVAASAEDVFHGSLANTGVKSGAALLLPHDVAVFQMKEGAVAFANPSICDEVRDPSQREALRRNPEAMKSYCRAEIEKKKESLRPGRSILDEYPMMVRACGRKSTLFFGEREFCESAIGYQRAVSRSSVEEQSELGTTASSSNSDTPPPQPPCAVDVGTVCWLRHLKKNPECGNQLNRGSTQFNCSSPPPESLTSDSTWFGSGLYPVCCSGRYRSVTGTGELTDRKFSGETTTCETTTTTWICN